MALPKVLLVDDEKDNLEALTRLLRKDAEIHSAGSGEEALDLFSKHSDWDAVISDQRMPGMSGSEFFEKIQKIDSDPTRILLTGFADMAAVIEAVNRGHIWRYIAKPWEPDDFKVAVKQAVERTRMRRSLEKSRKDLERALNDLRARDWSRERLLQILLHEFRTAPQILQNVIELGETKIIDSAQEKFLKSLILRFEGLEKEIMSLLEEEKRTAQLSRENIDLGEMLDSLSKELKFPWQNNLLPKSAKIRSHKESLRKIFTIFYELLSKNSQNLPVRAEMESISGQYFVSFKLSSPEKKAILPLALQGQNLNPAVAWPALLEPFVGGEDFLLHSQGLRLETARWVRVLAALGYKSEFVLSGDLRESSSELEWVVAFKSEL